MSGGEPLTCAFDGIASRVDASGFRSVGFTSAVLGEGVTTTTLGTALSLAALRGESVLLVDASWRQPSLTDDAAAGAAPGLAGYLAKKADLAALIRLASRSRLAFVPVGDRTCAGPPRRRWPGAEVAFRMTAAALRAWGRGRATGPQIAAIVAERKAAAQLQLLVSRRP